jgi:hypothetical protein
MDVPDYHRGLLLRRNLHPVTTLLPTETARAVGGFGEDVPGWEDWEFYMRLAVAGYCGAKVHSPTLLYRLATGVNRERDKQGGSGLYEQVVAEYADYRDGRPMMACCGANAAAKEAARLAVAATEGGMGKEEAMRLEYMGDGRTYYGGRNASDRLITPDPRDVAGLLALGVWRVAAIPAQMPRMPQPRRRMTPAPAVETVEVSTTPNDVGVAAASFVPAQHAEEVGDVEPPTEETTRHAEPPRGRGKRAA